MCCNFFGRDACVVQNLQFTVSFPEHVCVCIFLCVLRLAGTHQTHAGVSLAEAQPRRSCFVLVSNLLS